MEVLNIVKEASGDWPVSLLSGAAPLVDADFIISEEPLTFSGLYTKNKIQYMFVITAEGYESTALTQ
jgi:hypothetical protein